MTNPTPLDLAAIMQAHHYHRAEADGTRCVLVNAHPLPAECCLPYRSAVQTAHLAEALAAAREIITEAALETYTPDGSEVIVGVMLTQRKDLRAAREELATEQARVQEARADGWERGHQVGWEHCQDGNYGTDHWDDDTPNPYRAALAEGAADQEDKP